LANPTVRRRELANRLRGLRLEARLTLEDAGRALEISAATMSRIENATRLPKARDVRDLCRLYRVDDATESVLLDLVEASREPVWWEDYSDLGGDYSSLIGLEAAAVSISDCRNSTVPGLLQSPDYLRAYITAAINPQRETPFSSREITERIEVAEKRQQNVARPTLTYVAYLDEAALQRVVGGPRVMVGQITHFLSLLDPPRVTLRLLPNSLGAHPGQPGGFTVIDVPEPDVPDVVYIDSLAGQLFLDAPEDLARHRRVIEQLDGMALSTEQTRNVLLEFRQSYSAD
jgi:transcriptional regulator with XRE-family HTH domain